MARVYPFKALRPKSELAAQVASVPYDVVNASEAKKLAGENALSFLHVTKPEIDLPESIDLYSDEVYAQGRVALDQFVADGVLAQDDSACFYLYRLKMGEHIQTGIVLGASVADYNDNLVRKHEYTRPVKEDDRVKHMCALEAQSGTVFLVHKPHYFLTQLTQRVSQEEPTYSFVSEDAIEHILWVIDDAQDIESCQAAFTDLGPIYIADGHHRSAAASRYVKEKAQGQSGPWDMFLAVSFPTNEIKILSYNRVVKDLKGHSPEEFLTLVAASFEIGAGKVDLRRGCFNMFLQDKWYHLQAKPALLETDDPVAALDVSLLQEYCLDKILDIQDPRRDSRVDFVGGIRGDAELEKRVSQGWAAAFSLYPTSIDDLLTIADADQVMPPKSTWFEPKLRDGLIIHKL